VKNLIASIVVTAGLASVAAGQITRMDVETSVNGTTWTSGTRLVNPGTAVQVRYRVSFIANGTTAVPTGFHSLSFQPTFSNWTNADTLAPFAVSGNNISTPAGSVTDASGAFGRISPFAATGTQTTDPYRGHVQTDSGTTYLRIARNTITNWVGNGPTTTTGAANNFNGSGGLPLVQKNINQIAVGEPAFAPGITNILLAKFGFTLSADSTVRTLTISAPTLGMTRTTATGLREASWFESAQASFGAIKGVVEVVDAQVQVIPAPGALCLVGAGGLVALRRRR